MTKGPHFFFHTQFWSYAIAYDLSLFFQLFSQWGMSWNTWHSSWKTWHSSCKTHYGSLTKKVGKKCMIIRDCVWSKLRMKKKWGPFVIHLRMLFTMSECILKHDPIGQSYHSQLCWLGQTFFLAGVSQWRCSWTWATETSGCRRSRPSTRRTSSGQTRCPRLLCKPGNEIFSC